MQRSQSIGHDMRVDKVFSCGLRLRLALRLLVALALASAAVGFSWSPGSRDRQKPQDFGLPELHTIKSAILEPSYSCRSADEFQRGYEKTALFLSNYSRDMNSPELLFDGACRGDDFVHSALAGDSMSLIEDMGEIALADATAQSVFLKNGLHFTQLVKVQLNHTYAVLVNESYKRALFLFTVVGHVPHERLDIDYAVKEYQVLNVQSQSPGSDWGKRNF